MIDVDYLDRRINIERSKELNVMAAAKQQEAGLGLGLGVFMIWDVRCSFQSLIALLVLILVGGAVYLTAQSGHDDHDHYLLLAPAPEHDDDHYAAASSTNYRHDKYHMNSPASKCNLFSGKWVYDNESYPLYRERQCSFMSDQLACEKFGRKDLSYQHWRWQPHHCDLPRFNGTALLERLRNKRLVLVGDSLNRGQWVSLVCLLDTSMPPSSPKSMINNGSLITFKATDYNASIEFYWAPLLVESNSDDPVNHRLPERIVRAHSIEKHAHHWTDAHILVFNTYLWWRRPKMKTLWGSFGNSDGIYKDVEMLRSYEMALKTWADWLEFHVNRNKTQLYFMSMSPTHERAEEWGTSSSGENCYSETEIIGKEEYGGNGSDPEMMRIVEETINDLKHKRGLKVQLINITQLSEYRKEGHPSIYRKQWEPLTHHQLSNPSSYADCIHWCLPGVPDVWNQLLYAYILHNSSN